MKRRLLALLLTLAMIAGTYGTIPALLAHLNKGTQHAAAGVLDLSQWRFAEAGVAKLDGEWEFYPHQLLEAKDFAGGKPPAAQIITVPASWGSQMELLGQATYRLRVNISDPEPIYGLKTLSIQMAARILVNGQEVGSSGKPGDEATYIGKNKPIVTYFKLHSGLNEIIVQAANFHSPSSSGINHSIFLGYHEQITKLQNKALSHDWVMISMYTIMGLYFIGLYTQRRRDVFLIIFGIMSLMFALFASTRGERIIFELYEDLPIWLFLRVQILAAIFAGLAILLYVYWAFRPYCSKLLVWFGIGLGIVMSVLEIGFFSEIQNGIMQPITTLYSNVPFIYLVYVLLSAALHRVEGSVYLVVAAVANNILGFFQNLNVYFTVPVYTFPPVEPLVYLLMIALHMSLRFSNAFKQVEQLSGQLIQADKLKDEFLTKTAHEFKTPLHGMIHIAESVVANPHGRLSPEQRDNLGLIASIAKRLSQLVYDILDFSKLKEGRLAIHTAPMHVGTMVEVSMKVFDFLTAGKPVKLENRVPDDLPYVLADEARFRQIISNLLDNALKHTEQGSIVITAETRGSMVEIAVRDTGEGIEEHDLSVIFKPYESLEQDSYRSFGLGLPIVKQLVELQQGEIRVQSMKGEGSIFTFTLPIAAPGTQRVSDRAPEPTPLPSPEPEYSFHTPYRSASQGAYTVLVVDDSFSNLKVLIDSLERLGYTVIAVKNGIEALSVIHSQSAVDLVILDLMMPGLSGFEVCRAIRGRFSLLELPVLMVTASIHSEDKIAAFEAGANDYLPKPFEAAELRARAKSLLTMKESAGRAVDMEVAFLQSQIKPHFLYNVLNTIMALSYMDVDKSRKLTTDLANYLRGSFSFNNIQKGVSFKSELALIQSYVEIEKVRFKDMVHIEYEIADEAQVLKLPPLLIQPLVENAIRHGIGTRVEGGTIVLRVRRAEEYFLFEIEDNGVGMTKERLEQIMLPEPEELPSSKSGVGLRNISKRLKYAYGTEMQVESRLGAGTKVTLRIPAKSA